MNKFLLNRLTPKETADALGVSEGTLAVWRCTKRYCLPFIRIGRKIFYRHEDIEKFISARTYCETSVLNS